MQMQNEKEVGIKNRQGLTMREIMARGDEKSSRVEILTREISRRESAMAFKFNGFRFALGMLMMKLDALKAGAVARDDVIAEGAGDVDSFIFNIPVMRSKLSDIDDMYESAIENGRETFYAQAAMRKFFRQNHISMKVIDDSFAEAKWLYYQYYRECQAEGRKDECREFESYMGMPIEDFIRDFKWLLRVDNERTALREELKIEQAKENPFVYDGYGWIRAVCLNPEELAEVAPVKEIGDSESKIWEKCNLEWFDKAWDFFEEKFPKFVKYRKHSTYVRPEKPDSEVIGGFQAPPGWACVFGVSSSTIKPMPHKDESWDDDNFLTIMEIMSEEGEYDDLQ